MAISPDAISHSIDSAPPSCFGIGFLAMQPCSCGLCEIVFGKHAGICGGSSKEFRIVFPKNYGEDSHFDIVLDGLKRATRNDDFLEEGKL